MKLLFVEFAGEIAARLVAKLCDPLFDQGLVDFVVTVHGAVLGVAAGHRAMRDQIRRLGGTMLAERLITIQ